MWVPISIIFLLILCIFIKTNQNEFMWNIPTRYCSPSRYTSPYDIRGMMPIPYPETTIPFGMSELIGPSYEGCYDDFLKRINKY